MGVKEKTIQGGTGVAAIDCVGAATQWWQPVVAAPGLSDKASGESGRPLCKGVMSLQEAETR